jgi:carbonic anhydrase
MTDFGGLISGFRVFKATTFPEQRDIAGHLIRQGVKPTTLIITCSDLRISPESIFSSRPGDLFTLRNIAGLVPQYGVTNASSMISAIEYAVMALNVESIVVLGHAKCDSIKLLMGSDDVSESVVNVRKSKNIQDWLAIADAAKEAVNKQMANQDILEREGACEKESILVSIKNLLTFPFVLQKIEDGTLKIYGWHFNIESGQLQGFNPVTKFFDPIG